MDPEVETLLLPTDYSLGRIAVYPPGQGERPQLIDARGSVVVPKDANLFLDISKRSADHRFCGPRLLGRVMEPSNSCGGPKGRVRRSKVQP